MGGCWSRPRKQRDKIKKPAHNFIQDLDSPNFTVEGLESLEASDTPLVFNLDVELRKMDDTLNADVRLALTTLDDRLVRALEVGDIRLVRAAWLLAQPADYRMVQRQDLEALEAGGAFSHASSHAGSSSMYRTSSTP